MKTFSRSPLFPASSKAAIVAVTLVGLNASAQALSVRAADPNKFGDGTIGAAARAAKQKGYLPASRAEVEMKAGADRARANAQRSARPEPAGALEPSLSAASGVAPALSTTFNIEGQGQTGGAPSGASSAIGPTRLIQLVNSRAGIYGRTAGALLVSGTLNELAGVAPNVDSFNAQIIWDPTTKRYYYAMNSIFSATDNEISFGFSRVVTPTNLTTDWCHYLIPYGAPFPDFPRLGDSRHFLILGVNTFSSNDPATATFTGSDLIAVSKPPAGGTCPAFGSFIIGSKTNLLNAFTPVPANQIDSMSSGYAVARDLTLTELGSASRLWLFRVSRNSTTGEPVFSNARAVNVATHFLPSSASQPGATQVLDTLDLRFTQAVQAFDPRLGTYSLWTQHTIANGPNGSRVRWYEIDPVPGVPVIQRWGNISRGVNSFVFNAAITPDRRVDGATTAFGENAVAEYNLSSQTNNIPPRIMAASSLNGAAFTSANVRAGVGPYVDFTCPNPGDLCRWGDYSSVGPDPRPTSVATGQVWGTNQYSGLRNPSTASSNFRTRIFRLDP